MAGAGMVSHSTVESSMSGGRGGGGGPKVTWHKVKAPLSRVHDTGYRIHTLGFGLQDPHSRVWAAGSTL